MLSSGVARRNSAYQRHSITTRILIILFGATAMFWGASVLPQLWRYAALERIANHIIAGEPFKTKALAELAPVAEAVEEERLCNPDRVRAAAIVRLRLFEAALAGDDEEAIDPRIESLQGSTRRALSCLPSDSFLWVVLYWVDVNRNGYRPEDLEYLRMSYTLGANEGWVALKRNRLALAIFDQLPWKVGEMAVAEFANLLNSGFEAEVADILIGPGWKVRDRLLIKLKDVRESYRRDFAKALYHGGYDVTVPGIKLPDPRPWD